MSSPLLSFSFINIRLLPWISHLLLLYLLYIYFLDLSVSMVVSLTPGFRMGIHVVFNLIGSLRKYWKFLNAIRDIYMFAFIVKNFQWFFRYLGATREVFFSRGATFITSRGNKLKKLNNALVKIEEICTKHAILFVEVGLGEYIGGNKQR